MDRSPIRIQRMLMRLRWYNLVAEHVPGKLLLFRTLYRVQPNAINASDSAKLVSMVEDIDFYTTVINSARPIADRRLCDIRDATERDEILQEAMNHTRYGWPQYASQVKLEVRDYFNSRSELSLSSRLLLYIDRIVVPEMLRPELLQSIHEGHLGLNKCRPRAHASVWWPGIGKDIQRMIEKCTFCQTHRPSQRKKPLKVTPLPDRPWQNVAADRCELNGKQYLVVIDYYSRFLEIAYLPSITSEQVIGKLKNIFARWGVPEEFVSDNGRKFTSHEFKTFAEKYGFQQTFSSPHFPQSNGEAQSAVKVAKNILRQDDIFAVLMSYRATPITAT